MTAVVTEKTVQPSTAEAVEDPFALGLTVIVDFGGLQA